MSATLFLSELLFSKKGFDMERRPMYANRDIESDLVNSFKRMAQETARETAENIRRLGVREVPWSRGESADLLDMGDHYLVHVNEDVGTKMQVADIMYDFLGVPFDNLIAQDAVAMIVNDLITSGAIALSLTMKIAAGSPEWFKNEMRGRKLLDGWKYACAEARCRWGGGQTSILKTIVMPGTAAIGGSGVGIIKPKTRILNPENIRPGDAILLLESSGIHANGLTRAREIAETLPEGYRMRLPNGRFLGEVLLDPTHIYAGFMEDCLASGVEIHYAVHITGEGWKKLMRAPQPFCYVIEELPPQPVIFEFLQRHGRLDDKEAFATFNMGAGFALYVPEKQPEKNVEKILDIIRSADQPYPFRAWRAGHIEASGETKLVIKQKNLEYPGSSLRIR
jgi:phosphoribosylformylglycinamidine cyclo-ligase